MRSLYKFVMAVCVTLLFMYNNAEATCSNYTTYIDGEVFTASSINSLQTNYTNCVNDVLNGDVFTGDMTWHSGSDALFYSDTGSTLKAKIFGDSGIMYGAPQKVGPYGINLNLTSGELEIECNNAACSTSNPGFVVMQSNTSGDIETLIVDEATHLFEDASATSDIIGMEFGTTAGTAWGSDSPFAVYALNCSSTIYFGISTNPALTTSPASAGIGYHGNPSTNNTDDDMFVLTSTDVTSTCASAPALLIGAYRMTKDASDDWTTTALDDGDGIGVQAYNFGVRVYDNVKGHYGSSAGKFGNDSSGAWPAWSTEEYKYKVFLNGQCWAQIFFDNDGGTDGSGAVTAFVGLPRRFKTPSSNDTFIPGAIVQRNGTEYHEITFRLSPGNGDGFVGLYRGEDGANLTNSGFGNGDRRLSGGLTYRCN